MEPAPHPAPAATTGGHPVDEDPEVPGLWTSGLRGAGHLAAERTARGGPPRACYESDWWGYGVSAG
ncbi:hypothetical protein GCM10023168_29190 [Fodinibacter luteus]|uniref:Uncharacterized protein n=1 Tax=Fodinibacter luteus TaxID=552064 RepID=A0ABP8KMF7_9MICO